MRTLQDNAQEQVCLQGSHTSAGECVRQAEHHIRPGRHGQCTRKGRVSEVPDQRTNCFKIAFPFLRSSSRVFLKVVGRSWSSVSDISPTGTMVGGCSVLRACAKVGDGPCGSNDF